MRAFFRYGVSDNYDKVLYYELQDLKKEAESRWYWIAAEFVIDKIKEKDNGVTLFWVRRPRQRREKAVILQSDWNGMQYFHIKS